jgi:hypothetical protein
MKIKIVDIAVKAGGVSAGAVLAKFADKLVPNLNPAIRGAAKIAIGAVVPAFMPKQKFVEHMGNGMIAVGAVELAGNFVPAIVSGTNDSPMSGIGSGEPMTIDEDYEAGLGEADDDDEEMAGANDDPMGAISDDEEEE